MQDEREVVRSGEKCLLSQEQASEEAGTAWPTGCSGAAVSCPCGSEEPSAFPPPPPPTPVCNCRCRTPGQQRAGSGLTLPTGGSQRPTRSLPCGAGPPGEGLSVQGGHTANAHTRGLQRQPSSGGGSGPAGSLLPPPPARPPGLPRLHVAPPWVSLTPSASPGATGISPLFSNL